tara:strand:- start:3644 stop:4675 length:1032 start_codon:yes stop_codon:yes gene_type:complete
MSVRALELIEECILDNAGRYYHRDKDGLIPEKVVKIIFDDVPMEIQYCRSDMNKVYKKVSEEHFKELESLSLEDRIKQLGFKNEKDCLKCYQNSKHRYFFEDDLDKLEQIFTENSITEPTKERVKPKPLELNIPNCIKDDYDKFNCKISIRKQYAQDLNFSPKYTIDNLLSFTDTSQFTGYFHFDGLTITWTKSMYDNIVKDDKIIDIKLYEFLLFNNILSKNNEEFTKQQGEDTIIESDKMNEFYKNEFRPYFYKKYKDLIKESEKTDITKLKIFDYFYKQINPNQYNKRDNPREYNTYSTNKSNLKKSYKRYLNDEDINELPNSDKLKYIVFIINNCDKYF